MSNSYNFKIKKYCFCFSSGIKKKKNNNERTQIIL